MSFSFAVTAPTKAEAKAQVAAELDKVVAAQPIHESDRAAVQATAETYVDLLHDEPDHTVGLSVSGSCSHSANGHDSFSVSIHASLSMVRKSDAEIAEEAARAAE